MTAIARAHPNIALVKYWGKRDEELILPETGSLSMTLDAFPTTTSVTLTPAADRDEFLLGGQTVAGKPLERVVTFLEHVRSLAGSTVKARVESSNEVPTAAGLASSAAGFAALAVAAAAEYGLELSERDLSRLARRGSGSACRSIPGGTGFAIWRAGSDDESSYAEAVPAPEMRMVVLTLDAGSKSVSSREAMRRCAATSPFHDAWVSSTAQTLVEAEAAAAAGDFTTLGELTESNALRMHAHINGAFPPIRYLAPASIAAFDAIAGLRAAGVEVYGTADAGPNVVAVCRPADAEAVAAALGEIGPTTVVAPGPGATLVSTTSVSAS
ncbi:MAG: diphosphomevalonate decarboxylase [Galactobacter sp.]